MLNLQHLLDGYGLEQKKKRASSQLTLGKLIKLLEAIPDEEVAYLHSPRSYRGYYEDLAFELNEGTRPSYALLAVCRSVMGEVLEGYKGGEYLMGASTPLWISSYGKSSGVKLISLKGTQIQTEVESWE